jgi:hypothetical protein
VLSPACRRRGRARVPAARVCSASSGPSSSPARASVVLSRSGRFATPAAPRADGAFVFYTRPWRARQVRRRPPRRPPSQAQPARGPRRSPRAWAGFVLVGSPDTRVAGPPSGFAPRRLAAPSAPPSCCWRRQNRMVAWGRPRRRAKLAAAAVLGRLVGCPPVRARLLGPAVVGRPSHHRPAGGQLPRRLRSVQAGFLVQAA